MRKIIAGINMTIDGFCDHTGFLPDEEIHTHYAEQLGNADAILFGRITFELMQFWQELVKNPSGEKAMDDFANAIDKIPKIVFSSTLNNTAWESAKISDRSLEETILTLKHQEGKDILIGSRSLIIQLANLHLIDEFQLCIHPIMAAGGKPLFEHLNDRTILKLIKTKTFKSGAVILYYEPTEND